MEIAVVHLVARREDQLVVLVEVLRPQESVAAAHPRHEPPVVQLHHTLHMRELHFERVRRRRPVALLPVPFPCVIVAGERASRGALHRRFFSFFVFFFFFCCFCFCFFLFLFFGGGDGGRDAWLRQLCTTVVVVGTRASVV